ncbi:hypothetical protein [Rudaea sp.]|uniref:hypothetical protein n=1 Tax=Rudaea sp. TaxID=2136325 RepID=UPI002ED017C2
MARAVEVFESADIDAQVAAVDAALMRSHAGEGDLDSGTTGDARGFSGGVVVAPEPGWASAVAVAFASDVIDLWPLKPRGAQGFEYKWYPVAALPPDLRGARLWRAIAKMLIHFKPRK